MADYKLEDLTGTYTQTHEGGKKLDTPREEAWHDEDKMIAHMLLDGVLWTREAHFTFNKGSEYEGSGRGTVLFVNSNDIFAWGCADAEDLPHDEVPALFALWHESHAWGAIKWCCFRRKEQPQAPIKRDMIKNGVWCKRMDALPENVYDKKLKERAAAKDAKA